MYTTYTGRHVRLRPWRDRNEYQRANVETTLEPNPWWGPMWYTGTAQHFDSAGMLDDRGPCSFALELVDGGRWIGFEDFGGLSVTGLAAWVGTYILPEHQARGYGTEAKQLMQCHLFENFPIEVVWADTASNHRNAMVSLERCGMKSIGRQQAIAVSNGDYIDREYYAVFREEWEAMPFRREVTRG